jgi:hypothetical protein
MKGTLHKTEQGWVVRYLQTEPKYIGERQSLQGVFIHPDYVALCSYSFYEGKEIEFEILQEGNGFLYAHLFKNPKEQQDGYDTISELDKLAEKTFKGDDATTFVQREIWKDGYKKAKEIEKKQSQPEISDEEIEKASQQTYPIKGGGTIPTRFDLDQYNKQIGFVSGIMWYRKKLKNK